jgi:transposase, IS30 family
MPYHHLTPIERGQIEALFHQGKSRAAIGRLLGRHRSSIGRELSRNGVPRKPYFPGPAQERYRGVRKECVRTKRLDYPPLRKYLFVEGSRAWSPEQVAGRLRVDYPHDGRMHVSPETIYRTIYRDEKLGRVLIPQLRQARKVRRKKGMGKHSRNPIPIPNRVSIEQRPEEVQRRERYGDWEGDTVIGSNHRSVIATLVERKSLLLCAARVGSKQAEAVAQAITDALRVLPSPWRKTVTFDNGTEFARHENITQALGADIYFAHPYASNERARNENTNGLLRQYLPKGTSFENLTQQQLNAIVQELNDRPRKSLGYRTPKELFQNACVALEV